MTRLLTRAIQTCTVIGLLAACSGGGGDGGASSGPPPVPNSPPSFSSPTSVKVDENIDTVIYTATASDPEGGTLTYEVTGGADASAFRIGASSGELSFDTPPDFDTPGDADGNNIYDVAISARDPAGAIATLSLAVEVENITDAVQLRRVGSGFDQSLFLAGLPDTSGRVLVVEKTGRIRLLDPETGAIDTVPFLDVSSEVSTNNERGLLGLTFSPEFETDRTLYVNLTNLQGDTEIRRYQTFAGRVDQLDPSTEELILGIPQPRANHNAGWIGFDANGLFYIPTGDSGGFGDPDDAAQDPNSLLGKILRIDVTQDDFPAEAGRNYAIPPGNTFDDPVDGRPEIYAVGLRNPYRASFDARTGDLIIGDVGQANVEEVDRLAIDDPSRNFGWPLLEGTEPFKGGDGSGLTAPVAQYFHAGPDMRNGRSITGGVVHRGRVEELENAYVFADFLGGNVWSIPETELVDGETFEASGFRVLNDLLVPDVGNLFGVTAIEVTLSGDLYFVTFGGEIFRMEKAG